MSLKIDFNIKRQLILKLKDILEYGYLEQKTLTVQNPPDDQHYLITVKLPVSSSFYLFVTIIDNIYLSVFINKSNHSEIYSVKFRFSEEIYQKNTLFEGDLYLNNRNTWSFYINNISTRTMDFGERLLLINSIIKTKYTWDIMMNVCHLEIKPFFLKEQLDKKSSVKILGYIYTPLITTRPRLIYFIN
jgi:hypothetical protein